KPPRGMAPSSFVAETQSIGVQLWRIVKLLPFVFIENTTPLPPLPPAEVVPKRVSPDKTRPLQGSAPSAFVPATESSSEKSCSTDKNAPLVLNENTAPFAAPPPAVAVP